MFGENLPIYRDGLLIFGENLPKWTLDIYRNELLIFGENLLESKI